jgi:hypothetical protein
VTISNPTPHEQEATRVAEELTKLGCWAIAASLMGRINGRGVNDDAGLRDVLKAAGRTDELIDESIRRVHAAIEATDASPSGEGW